MNKNKKNTDKKINSEIESLRNKKYYTIRPVSNNLEKILYSIFPVLNKGFLRVIDYMGNDSSIVQAARVSYGKGTKKVSEDRGLIRYLMRHRHSTPFEMCEIKFHVKLPIFVARQWIRHRTASINEYSARYSILEDEFYIPTKKNLSEQAISNKQGRGDVIDDSLAKKILDILKNDSDNCYKNYSWMLNESNKNSNYDPNRAGLSRELARINLTLNTYTQWYWKTNLHNFMNFLSLRSDSHSQYEIRVYSDVMMKVLKKWVPLSYEAFNDYRVSSSEFSKLSIDVIKKLISGKKINHKESGLSKREWLELMSSLDMN